LRPSKRNDGGLVDDDLVLVGDRALPVGPRHAISVEISMMQDWMGGLGLERSVQAQLAD
jgi:hypothetical protein